MNLNKIMWIDFSGGCFVAKPTKTGTNKDGDRTAGIVNFVSG
jgi:hypothetical protein